MSLNATETLLELRAIEQLKYRYVRAIDTQDWDLMRRCLAEDVDVWVGNGKYVMKGRETMVEWLSGVINASVYTAHIVTHPEIELTGETTAKGVWRLQEIDYFTAANPEVKDGNMLGGERMEGVAYYYDEYLKVGGEWIIASTGFIRIFDAIWRPDFGGDAKFNPEPNRGVRPTEA